MTLHETDTHESPPAPCGAAWGPQGVRVAAGGGQESARLLALSWPNRVSAQPREPTAAGPILPANCGLGGNSLLTVSRWDTTPRHPFPTTPRTTPGRAEVQMAERLMTYAEMEVALRRTPEAVRQLVKRKRWRRVVGNDRKARIAVPLDFIEANVPDDTQPSVPDDADTTPRTTPGSSPEGVPDVRHEPTGPTGDARVLIEMLQGRVAELAGEVKDARVLIADLTAKAGRADVAEALLDVERRRADELRTERDRLLDRLTAAPAAPARRSWWPWRRSA